MLCVKCGKEYEGSQCPYCDGPVILVNNSDYLARKKAYEQKQALKEKSASSSTKNKKTKPAKQSRQSKAVRKRENSSEDNYRDNNNKYTIKKFKADKNKIKLIVSVSAIILILLSCLGLYKLVTRKNYVLYMSNNGRIYNMAGMESEFVCESYNAVFTSDHKTFYQPEFPNEVDSDDCVDLLASDEGKYFAAVSFDETNNEYTTFVWNTKGLCEVNRDSDSKELLFISDDGVLVYTSTPIINTEGKAGNTKTCVAKINKLKATVTNISMDNRNTFVYSANDLIVSLDNDGTLALYDYDRMEKSVIEEEVESILAMSSDSKNTFCLNTDKRNSYKSADAVIYRKGNIDHYYNLLDKTNVKLGANTGYTTDYIYYEGVDYVIKITENEVLIGEVSEQIEYTVLDTISKERNYIYMPDDKQLLLVNSDGELKLYKKTEGKTLCKNVVAGSLSKVYNKNRAVCYVTDNKLYYLADLKKNKPVVLSEADSDKANNIKNICYYKKRIYFYNGEKTLYSASVKGKDLRNIGNVDSFWVGTTKE